MRRLGLVRLSYEGPIHLVRRGAKGGLKHKTLCGRSVKPGGDWHEYNWLSWTPFPRLCQRCEDRLVRGLEEIGA